MIKREEAKEKFTEYIKVPSVTQREIRIHKAFDEIYDSIGSCSTCEYYDDIGRLCRNTVGVSLVRQPDFFCADFKRKD